MNTRPDRTAELELLDVVYEMVALGSSLTDDLSEDNRKQQIEDLWKRVYAAYERHSKQMVPVQPDPNQQMLLRCGHCGEIIDSVTSRIINGDNDLAIWTGVLYWDADAARFIEIELPQEPNDIK